MPAPGDQHKQPNGTAMQNPFEEQKPHISEYTAQEIATLSSRLNKRLGPEYISTRAGPGNTRVAYLPAEKAINLANEVFGFNGWSSSIQNIQIDFVDEHPTKGTISIGLSVVVRVTLKDGTYHEDTGYGGIENCRSKIAAFEKAKKEGTTDALKRALRNFGNVLGNCIYDKDYITKVSKVKAGTGKWDVNELHRHQDFAPKKEEEPAKQPAGSILTRPPPDLMPEDSFDVNDFDDADLVALDNPDEVLLPPETGAQHRGHPQPNQNSRHPPYHQMTASKPPQNRPNQPPPQALANTRQLPHPRGGPTNAPENNQQPPSRSSSPGMVSQHLNPAQPQPQAPPGPQSVGFFSARAADSLDGNNNPTGSTAAPRFNPHAESPSIRKTSGVDHSKSVALNRNTLKPEPLVPRDEHHSPMQGQQQRPGVEQRRGIGSGQPIGGFSPVSAGRAAGGMTSAYRAPTRQGPVNNATHGAVSPSTGERVPNAAKRPPLSDRSNVQHSAGAHVDESEAKRQRVGQGLSGNLGKSIAPG